MFLNSIEKWKNANLDLVEEVLERDKKAIILLAGASSSGKSFSGKMLSKYLEENNLKSITLSTDSYNRGISHIIVDKVNDNHFNGTLKEIPVLKEIAKQAIINVDFNDNFTGANLKEIARNSKKYFEDSSSFNKYLNSLRKEFEIINFDEASVYDLPAMCKDVKDLYQGKKIMVKEYSKKISEQQPTNIFANGKDYDVIIVEGIYAMDDIVRDKLGGKSTISNFVLADDKTLFVRRVLRDSAFCPNAFTVKNYFERVLPAYEKEILPNSKKADIQLMNKMSFKELRAGDNWSIHKRKKVEDQNFLNEFLKDCKLVSKTTYKDYYLDTDKSNTEDNHLIYRVASFDDGKNFYPFGLVHKGYLKTRKDGKLIRPVNVLLSQEEIRSVFPNCQDFFNLVKNSKFEVSQQLEKTRYRLLYNGKNITVDKFANGETFIETNGVKIDKQKYDLTAQNKKSAKQEK